MASEGKRVVFVSVRGRDGGLPRTRRKRALGVSDDATWESFQHLVCSRLTLRGVKAIYHASSGAQLRSLEELQDIEDLEVEESEEAAGGGALTLVRKAATAHAALPPSVPAGGGSERGEEEDKYARRSGALPSLLVRILPDWASLSLASAPARLRGGLKEATDALREAMSGRRRKVCARRGARLCPPHSLCPGRQEGPAGDGPDHPAAAHCRLVRSRSSSPLSAPRSDAQPQLLHRHAGSSLHKVG